MGKTTKTDFKALQSKWYKKLKDEGFKDIEHDDGSINSGVPRSISGKDPELRQITQDYYCMAYHFLNSHKFDSELEKIIWEYHTEGLSIRSIVKVLNETKVTKTNRIKIWKTVQKLDTLMKDLYLSV